MFIIKYRVSLFPTLLTFGDQLDSARQVFNLQYFDPQVVSCSAMATAIFDDRRLRPFRVWLVEYLKLVYILHIYIYFIIYMFFLFSVVDSHILACWGVDGTIKAWKMDRHLVAARGAWYWLPTGCRPCLFLLTSSNTAPGNSCIFVRCTWSWGWVWGGAAMTLWCDVRHVVMLRRRDESRNRPCKTVPPWLKCQRCAFL